MMTSFSLLRMHLNFMWLASKHYKYSPSDIMTMKPDLFRTKAVLEKGVCLGSHFYITYIDGNVYSAALLRTQDCVQDAMFQSGTQNVILLASDFLQFFFLRNYPQVHGTHNWAYTKHNKTHYK